MTKKYLNELFKQIIFTSGSNLKLLLCRNKTKLLPNSLLGLYELECRCNSTLILVKLRKRYWQGPYNANKIALRKNCLYLGFLCPYFSTFGLNTETYRASLSIQSKCGKIRTRKLQIRTLFTKCCFKGK